MVNRKRHVLRPDTVETLLRVKENLSWRKVAVALGYPESYFGSLHKAASNVPGSMTREAEIELRRRLGLRVPARRQYYRPCFADRAEYDEYLAWRRERQDARGRSHGGTDSVRVVVRGSAYADGDVESVADEAGDL